jgi:hypothetical protein
VTISFVISVRPSVHVEQLGSHCTDFHKISCLNIFPKSLEKIKVSLKSDKNNGTLYEYQHIFMIISHSFLLRMRNVLAIIVEKIKTGMLFSIIFSRKLSFVRYCGKIWQNRERHRWLYGSRALHAGYLRLQTHTHNM